ncbi:hypothetical protein GCM10008024_00410 [Allgaiera indica]|uniref:Flagellar hook-basal body complex protein FliE n=1 Tax=Allgaiera indica TaxID=765699 RepID=A0AAN4ZX12_9RHOB|nr:flagellar hook-basal body complex protein FliE [Allgaiera indica]GHD98130.1 hypothetical protein GCM10008024_00410 [Allgaiera indica]
MTVPTLASLGVPEMGSALPTSSQSTGDGSFLGAVHAALDAVSQAQGAASDAETAVAAGKPGASQASALILSDRAELGWTGVVAVRNEIVSAYQTLTNMQI